MLTNSVLTCAPLRISFLGGGTDFASYFRNSGGAVVAASINKYVYVHIKKHDPLFQERFRVSYSEVEHCQSRSEIKNDIVRSSLELLDIDIPLQVSTSADLPSNSGLGSSSSFAVSLLLGLHELKGDKVSQAQLAEEAYKVESELIGSPVGKQDQYAAAFGGLNIFEFNADDSVSIEPISTQYPIVQELFSNSILVWTQQARSASHVLHDQEKRSAENARHLDALKKMVYDFRNAIREDSPTILKIAGLISSGWEIKKQLSPYVVTPEISSLFDRLSFQGSMGGKLLGAGAGGFILSIHNGSDFTEFVKRDGLATFKPGIDHSGARILSSN